MRVIDIAADFRLKDVALWEQWYKMKHACPELVAEAVYGLPEVNRERIREARIVANPGCYPTAVQLGFLPLVESGVVDLAASHRRREIGRLRRRPHGRSAHAARGGDATTSRRTACRAIAICPKSRRG